MQRLLTRVERRLHKFVDLPQAVHPDPDRYGLAMVCIAKNEENYICEWIEFHRIVGVRHFYIYVNDRIEKMRDVLQKYIDMQLVTLIPWQNYTTALAPQTLAYAHALGNYGSQYRWMGFIDVDEFLFPVQHETLNAALAPFGHLSGISIPWHMFGTSGHETAPDGLVVENYTQCAPFPPRLLDHQLLQYKSIVDPCAVYAMKNSHWFYSVSGQRVSKNERGENLGTFSEHLPARACKDIFRLNHYFTRSKSEIKAKLMSGRADRPGAPEGAKIKRTRKLWQMVERELVEDTAIYRFLPRLKHAIGSNLTIVPTGENIIKNPMQNSSGNMTHIAANTNLPQESVEA